MSKRKKRKRTTPVEQMEIEFAKTIDPWRAEVLDGIAREAVKEAKARILHDETIPGELRHPLMSAETNFYINDGGVAPFIGIDGGGEAIAIPPDANLNDAIYEAFRHHAEEYVYCAAVGPDDCLHVFYLDKRRRYRASSPIIRSDGKVRLGRWNVEADNSQSGKKVGRNSPCPCGSGRKYKKCCGGHGSKQTRQPMTKDQFAQTLVGMIRKANKSEAVEYDCEKRELLFETTRMSLSNAYRDYLDAPDWEKQDVLDHWCASWFRFRSSFKHGVPADFADVKHDLLPLVCARTDVLDESAHSVVGEHLAVEVVYDLPKSSLFLLSEHFSGWETTFDNALSLAMTNLREISFPPKFTLTTDGLWVSQYHDDYDSSRILLPEVIGALKVDGDPVAMTVNRRMLLVAGSDNPKALAAMVRQTEIAETKPLFLSSVPLRWDGASWNPYQPPQGHPCEQDFKRLWVKSMSRAYSRQKTQLYEEYEQSKKAIIADFLVPADDHGSELFSLSTWTIGGADTLLPVTDELSIWAIPLNELEEGRHPSEIEHYRCDMSWKDAMRVFGDRMKRCDMYPERYRISGMLSEDEFLAAFRIGTLYRFDPHTQQFSLEEFE